MTGWTVLQTSTRFLVVCSCLLWPLLAADLVLGTRWFQAVLNGIVALTTTLSATGAVRRDRAQANATHDQPTAP